MIEFNQIFQNYMVLQQNKEIRMWGKSDVKQKISVYINDKEILSDILIDKEFEILLPKQTAAYNVTVRIVGQEDKITFKNVDIGEVWIAGGQSNMQFLLKYEKHKKELISKAGDEHIRLFDVGKYVFDGEENEGYKDGSRWDRWLMFTKGNAPYFLAVGAYFAYELRKKYNVPVGIVGCNLGGTTASSWIDKTYLENNKELNIYLDEYEKSLKNLNMKKYIEKSKKARKFINSQSYNQIREKLLKGDANFFTNLILFLAGHMFINYGSKMGPENQNRPGGLYKTMFRKIAGYSAKGVIWYQGESDADKAQIYDELFSSVIKCWRRDFKDDLPFLFVQLAPFGNWFGLNGDNYPIIRKKQEIVSKRIKKAYMISIMDAGMKNDIHPKDKKTVGLRLSYMAMGKVYGEDILCEPPEFEKAIISKGKIEILFLNTGKGLEIKGNKLNAFELFVDKKKISDYTYKLNANRLTIKNKAITDNKNIKIKYAMKGYCMVNLYNSNGLAAKPFSFANK